MQNSAFYPVHNINLGQAPKKWRLEPLNRISVAIQKASINHLQPTLARMEKSARLLNGVNLMTEDTVMRDPEIGASEMVAPESRDPFIQTLFAEAHKDIQDDDFTDKVMARVTNIRRQLMLLLFAAIAAFFLVALLFSWPLLGMFTALTQFLGTEIFYIGNAAVATFLSPINNIVTVLVIVWRITRFGWSRATQAAYSS